MALVVGSNSWVSVAEADTYLEDTPGATDWFNLIDEPGSKKGEEAKSSFLVLAFRTLSTHPDLSGISASVSDDDVKDAQIEMALYLLRYREDLVQRGILQDAGVKQFEIGEWREEFFESGGSLPSHILSLLSGYLNYGNMGVQLLPENYVD